MSYFHGALHLIEVLGLCAIAITLVSLRDSTNLTFGVFYDKITSLGAPAVTLADYLIRRQCPVCKSERNIRPSRGEGLHVYRCESCKAGYLISSDGPMFRASAMPDTVNRLPADLK